MTAREAFEECKKICEQHAHLVASESARQALYILLDTLSARAAQEPDGWVSMSDRLPEVDLEVWYYFEITGVNYGKMLSGTCQADAVFGGRKGFLTGDVTHWMYAPLPPITALGSGGQTVITSDSQESPAAEHCPDAVPPFEPCGHERPQSAAQLHGVCIFCYRDRLGAAHRRLKDAVPQITADGRRIGHSALRGRPLDENGAVELEVFDPHPQPVVTLPPIVEPYHRVTREDYDALRRIAEKAVRLAEFWKKQADEEREQAHEQLEAAERQLAELRRGEFICAKCGIRKDAEHEHGDF